MDLPDTSLITSLPENVADQLPVSMSDNLPNGITAERLVPDREHLPLPVPAPTIDDVQLDPTLPSGRQEESILQARENQIIAQRVSNLQRATPTSPVVVVTGTNTSYSGTILKYGTLAIAGWTLWSLLMNNMDKLQTGNFKGTLGKISRALGKRSKRKKKCGACDQDSLSHDYATTMDLRQGRNPRQLNNLTPAERRLQRKMMDSGKRSKVDAAGSTRQANMKVRRDPRLRSRHAINPIYNYGDGIYQPETSRTPGIIPPRMEVLQRKAKGNA